MVATRFLFVDGLRGLAALAVVLFHVGRDYLGLPLLDSLKHGVTVFFVLSGFVISHALLEKKITGAFFFAFAAKRSIRLDPAYWTAILIAFGLIWLPSLVFNYNVELPASKEILLHLFYLQDLANVTPIDVVFWTLCYEMQFYLVFCGILYFLNKLSGGRLSRDVTIYIFAFFLLISFAWPLKVFSQITNGLFINLWFLFLLGVFARWASISKFALGVFITSIAVITVYSAFVQLNNPTLYVGLLTAILLSVAIHYGKMSQWLITPWIQYLGTISYSLYLLHNIIGMYVINTGLYLTEKYFGISSLLGNYFWCSLALIICIFSADLLYRYIEKPSHNLSRRIFSN